VNTVERFLKYWLPVLVWMSLIFGFSTDVGSSRHTSRIIGPVLRWIIPDISDEVIDKVQLVVRKGGHLTEYAILAVLAWRALRQPQKGDSRPWNSRHAFGALLIATLFAITDEWHQSTVPSRQGQVSDVILDTLGAGTGLAAIWLAGRILKR
jgi:VanZ family protein